MKNNLTILLTISILASALTVQSAFADEEAQLEFADALEETLGHFWAISLNLDDGNAELVEVHSLHPVEELYLTMKPQLQEADPAFDDRFREALVALKDRTNPATSTRAQADAALGGLTALVEEARALVVDADLIDDPVFRLKLMKTLLETSIAEYNEGVTDGEVTLLAEFQDGSAFVWRSQQILNEIGPNLDATSVDSMNRFYDAVNLAYEERADPSTVEDLTRQIINEINDLTISAELEFADALEETLGHFWAISLNLDDGNAELVEVHSLHPVEELYLTMKPQLQEADPAFDDRFREALVALKDRTNPATSTRAQADAALGGLTALVEEARALVVDADLIDDPVFRLKLMKTLLETSIAEYNEGVTDGEVTLLAEFQDGSAFVWRSQQILGEIRSDIDANVVGYMDGLYVAVHLAYDNRLDSSIVETLTGGIIDKIDEETGGSDTSLLDYVENIRALLADARTEYGAGNADLALSHVTKAYLNNYEFLEAPLDMAGEYDFMIAVETAMREDLRTMMKQNAPLTLVYSKIDQILADMDRVVDILGLDS